MSSNVSLQPFPSEFSDAIPPQRPTPSLCLLANVQNQMRLFYTSVAQQQAIAASISQKRVDLNVTQLCVSCMPSPPLGVLGGGAKWGLVVIMLTQTFNMSHQSKSSALDKSHPHSLTHSPTHSLITSPRFVSSLNASAFQFWKAREYHQQFDYKEGMRCGQAGLACAQRRQ